MLLKSQQFFSVVFMAFVADICMTKRPVTIFCRLKQYNVTSKNGQLHTLVNSKNYYKLKSFPCKSLKWINELWAWWQMGKNNVGSVYRRQGLKGL